MIISFNDQHLLKIWTIEDAKDGDILVMTKDGDPFIFKGFLDKFHPNCPVAYGGVTHDGIFDISSGDGWWDEGEISPATKVQYDLLFQKMKEAGYEWDAEKKELKEIKQNPAWSEEDEERIEQICEDLKCGLENFHSRKNVKGLHFEEIIKSNIDWLKSLKERCTWKPSDEQIAELKWVKEDIGGKSRRLLDSLYNDLKKLKE